MRRKRRKKNTFLVVFLVKLLYSLSLLRVGKINKSSIWIVFVQLWSENFLCIYNNTDVQNGDEESEGGEESEDGEGEGYVEVLEGKVTNCINYYCVLRTIIYLWFSFFQMCGVPLSGTSRSISRLQAPLCLLAMCYEIQKTSTWRRR